MFRYTWEDWLNFWRSSCNLSITVSLYKSANQSFSSCIISSIISTGSMVGRLRISIRFTNQLPQLIRFITASREISFIRIIYWLKILLGLYHYLVNQNKLEPSLRREARTPNYFGSCIRVVPPSERVVLGSTPFHLEPTSLIHWSLI